MTLGASAETPNFARTLEDLTDEAEMADGQLQREKVDLLYLKRAIEPDDAVKIETILKERGFVVIDSAIRDEDENETPTVRTVSHATAVEHLIADAKKVKLLTPDEEATFGEAIQKAEQLLQKPVDERTDIENRVITAGKRAFDSLVHHNIRLVIKFVYDPRYRYRHDIDDMVQMGLIGLMRAAERFDPTLGFRFSTYAMWWIRQGVHRGIANDGNTIRLPVHMIEHVTKFRRSLRVLGLTEGTSPNAVVRVAESLGWTKEYTARVAQIAEMRTVSFETPIGEEDSSTLGELIPDRLPGPEDMTITNDIAQQVRELLDELPTERQRDVIRRRFGLDGPEETLESIGTRYNVTRERIRQIEAKALKKLRRGAVRQRLRH
jgi:RNA polymerase primary sigma factor